MSSTKVKGKMSTVRDTLESLQISTKERNQISDKKVQDTSSKSTSEKEQTTSSSIEPSYIKSYSESQIHSTILDHTWKINQFKHFCKIYDQLESPYFSKEGQFIQMEIFKHKTDRSLRVIRFYIRTDEAFYGTCTTTIIYPPKTILLSKSISGHISNDVLLIELPQFNVKEFDDNCALVYCKFEIFHHFINNNIQMKLLPSSTVFSKDVKYLEDSTPDKIELENGESIKFIISPEQYIISKKLLCATNSTYFKNICLTHEKKVKDMTYDLMDYGKEAKAFKQILLYIKTGSLPAELCHNYEMLQVLLETADKYDVPALKLTCEHYLLRYITIENAIELMQLAVSTNAKFLEIHAVAFIQFHVKEIADTKKFPHLPKMSQRQKPI